MLSNTTKPANPDQYTLWLKDAHTHKKIAESQNELINQLPRKRGGRSWTAAQRAAASQRAAQNKPWVHATGPRTVKGRKIASKNALKTGMHTAEAKKFRRFIRDNARFLTLLNKIITAAKRQKKLIKTLGPLAPSARFKVRPEDDPVNFLLAKKTLFPVRSPP